MMEMLKNLVKSFEEKTGITFTGELKINGRLSRALGRCQAIITHDTRTGKIVKVNPIAIEVSKKFLEVATSEEIIDVLAHEFAHYCTYKTYGQHTHDSIEFIKYCKLLDTCHAPSMSMKNKIKSKYSVYCNCCNKLIARKATGNAGVVKRPHDFLSGCCHSKVRVEKNY